MGKMGFSFSWKRAVGISAAKGRISRSIGIPLTRSGRQRKFGRAAGCLVLLTFGLLCVGALIGGLSACGDSPTSDSCCIYCDTGCACGDSCIDCSKSCTRSSGCACNRR